METMESMKKEMERLKERIEFLEEENRQLISKEYFNQKYNERNAGRKSKITQKVIDEVSHYRRKGLTYRQIAEIMDLSVGLVHKAYH